MNWISVAGGLLFFAGVIVSIVLHELGHFVPARLFGVKATQFMVGFGKTLWSTKRGETEYGVKLVPLGAFVRMVGMFPPAKDGTLRRSSTGPFQQLMEEARESSREGVPEGEEHRLFYSKKPWQKLIIILGGPVMNLVIAVILFGVVLMGFGAYVSKTQVAGVSDCVVTATEEGRDCTADDPVAPARAAGFEVGDEIVAFNGTPIESWEDLQGRIREAGASDVTIDIERDGERQTLNAQLMSTERPDLEDQTETVEVGFLGLEPVRVREQQGVGATAAEIGEITVLTVQALGRVPERMVGVVEAALGGERERDSPMSLIGASRVAGEIAVLEAPAADRLATFIQWLAAVNLFLALFNLVPLLPLDGGHIAGALWESLRRKIARLFGRSDPGYVDVAKAMPLAYGAAMIIIVMGVVLLYTDIVNPVRLIN